MHQLGWTATTVPARPERKRGFGPASRRAEPRHSSRHSGLPAVHRERIQGDRVPQSPGDHPGDDPFGGCRSTGCLEGGELERLLAVPGECRALDAGCRSEASVAADKLPCRNELTAVTVSSEPEEGTAAQVTAKVVKWHELTAPSRPPRISYEIGGELEDSARSQGAITEKFSYPDLAIVILLGTQFNSIRKSPIVLLTIALALSSPLSRQNRSICAPQRPSEII